MVVALKENNAFSCVQAAKTKKYKYVVKDQISLTVTPNFHLFFKF